MQNHESQVLKVKAMSELESFARDWESHERSRHTRLIEELKREFRAEPKALAVGTAIASAHSPRLPPVAERSQVKPNDRYGSSRYQRNRHEPV